MSAAIPAEKFDALNAMIGQFKDAEERLKELEATEAEQEKVLEQRKRDQASKEPGVSSGGGNKSESELRLKGELADEVAWKKSQTEALKKDAPEGRDGNKKIFSVIGVLVMILCLSLGLIEGDPVQYFLVVSALQESIEELKSQKAFSESSLDNRMQNVAGKTITILGKYGIRLVHI